MLATDEDLALLHGSDHWVADGNFDFQPKGFVQLDYEMAAMSAFREVFPEATVKGCLFHFSQAVHRNVMQNGLEKVYKQTPPFDG